MDPIIFQFIISFIVKACITITFLIEFSRHKKKTIGLLVFIKIIEILSYVFRIYDVLLGYYSFQWIYALIYMFWIEKTFNIGRKSIGKWITLVLVLLIIPQIALIIQMNNLLVADRQLQSNWVVFLFGIQIIIYGGYFFYVLYHVFKLIREKNLIPPWLKKRYLFLMVYAINLIILGILLLFARRTEELELNWAFNLAFLVNYILIFTELLAWVMPKPLKHFFNRNWARIEEPSEESDHEMSEEELRRLWTAA